MENKITLLKVNKVKYVALLSFMLLSACIEEGSDQTKNVTMICIDQVQYWVLSPMTNGQSMSPKIDPSTLKYVNC